MNYYYIITHNQSIVALVIIFDNTLQSESLVARH